MERESRDTNPEPLSSIDADRLAASRPEAETGANVDYGYNVGGGEPQPGSRWDEREEYVPRQRPMGVTVIAVLNFVGAAISTLIFLLALGAGVDMGVYAFVLPLQIIFALVVGVGLFQLRNWARTAAFIGYGFNIAFNVLAMLTGPVEGSTLIGIAIAGIIIWYLRQPQVAEVFE
jgi:hypothetical protein